MSGECPVRCADELMTFYASWDIGASGAHTKTAQIPATFFKGVTRNSAGKYTVNFQAGAPVGPFVGLEVFHKHATGVKGLLTQEITGTYTSEPAGFQAGVTSGPSVNYEAWDAAGAANADPVSGDKILMRATWLKSRPQISSVA